MSVSRQSLAILALGALLTFSPMPIAAQTTQRSGDAPPAGQSYNPIPQRLVWPGIAVIVLIAIFVMAALAGPLIRANQQDEDDNQRPGSQSL